VGRKYRYGIHGWQRIRAMRFSARLTHTRYIPSNHMLFRAKAGTCTGRMRRQSRERLRHYGLLTIRKSNSLPNQVKKYPYQKTIYYKKMQWRPPRKKKKRGKKLSPRNTKACQSVSTALLKSVAETGT
jgi:hypothetical protein